MSDRYDLEKMLKEIQQDEAITGHTKKKEMLSQEDIKKLLEKNVLKKKKAHHDY